MIVKICDICNSTATEEEAFHQQCVAGEGQYDMCDKCYNAISEEIKTAAAKKISELEAESVYIDMTQED